MTKKAIPPSSFEEGEYMQAAIRELEPKEFEWMKGLMDKALEKSVKTLRPLEILEWTGYGLFIGDAGLISKKAIDKFQKLLLKIYHDEFAPGAIKLRNVTGGTMYMWRISLRPEMWESYDDKNRGQRTDLVTGKIYTVYKYFISKK